LDLRSSCRCGCFFLLCFLNCFLFFCGGALRVDWFVFLTCVFALCFPHKGRCHGRHLLQDVLEIGLDRRDFNPSVLTVFKLFRSRLNDLLINVCCCLLLFAESFSVLVLFLYLHDLSLHLSDLFVEGSLLRQALCYLFGNAQSPFGYGLLA
jgi:hypothetical protein